MKEQRIIGLSIGIIKNGKIIKAAGYGQSNIELNTPASAKTMYKIGSLSKQFIAAGIIKLVTQGKITLADPITKFIKDAPAKWSAITIRNLLNHTSGLPVEPPGFDGMLEVADSVYIKRAFADTLAFPPGTKYEYSNLGYFVLADVVRIVSGRSYADYLKKYFFVECGMNHTLTTSLEAIVPNRAAGYIESTDKQIRNAPDYLAVRPSGAFLSNINDLLQWEMAMQAGKLLQPLQWNQLWENGFQTQMTMDSEPIYYGFGWMANKIGGKQLIHHAGSLPGFKSVYFRYKNEKRAIIILANSDQADLYAIAFGISELLEKKASN